jgi:predicted dehydrogenase
VRCATDRGRGQAKVCSRPNAGVFVDGTTSTLAAMSAAKPIRAGVIGLGYWGPNVARNLAAIPGCELAWCCEADEAGRERWRPSFPGTRFTAELDELLEDAGLDAIAVTTPVPTHAALAERVLSAGKDCFVEKPLAQATGDAERVRDLAEGAGRVLMVGHLLEYHPGVQALGELVAAGELGDPYYIYSHRLNLGKLRADENALWSMGAHDVSVLLALAREAPSEVSARGESYVRAGVEDVVFAYLAFPSGLAAHMHLSWLDPHKERRVTVVGSKRMATFDDMALEHKLTIYDKGFDPDAGSYGEYITRSGGSRSPAISNHEPLRIECEHFVDCVRSRARPRSDGVSGVRVVQVLEALQASLEAGGEARPLPAAAPGGIAG